MCLKFFSLNKLCAACEKCEHLRTNQTMAHLQKAGNKTESKGLIATQIRTPLVLVYKVVSLVFSTEHFMDFGNLV